MEGERGDEQRAAPDEGLPQELLAAIAAPGGGRVVLVTGAGCSKEPPSGLPLSGELAARCHQELVDDRVLDVADCSNPNDLSTVAEAVFAKLESQRELVERFPPNAFEHAEPNEGHELAASLLREGALSCILTLNFDLAFNAALTEVSAGADITTIRRPSEYNRMGALTLVYLHGAITNDADELILRRDQLDQAWKTGWEEVVVQRVVGGPVTVFVGLGSPAAVLVETTKRIREKIADRVKVFVVGPEPRAESAFFAELDLDPEAYVQLSWTEFAKRLADRLVKVHRHALEEVCKELARLNDWDEEDVSVICDRMERLGLVRMGRLRAHWLLRAQRYAPQPRDREALRLVAELVVAVAMIERVSAMTASFIEEGVVEFASETKRVHALVGSGGGSLGWAALEHELERRRRRLAAVGRRPTLALVGAMNAERQIVAPPPKLAREQSAASVVDGAEQLIFVTTAELLRNPDVIHELVA